jgi:hypothetical protein
VEESRNSNGPIDLSTGRAWAMRLGVVGTEWGASS